MTRNFLKFIFSSCFNSSPSFESTSLPATSVPAPINPNVQVAQGRIQLSQAERSPIRTEPRRIVKQDKDLIETAQTAKKMEWIQVLKAMHKSFADFLRVDSRDLSVNSLAAFNQRLNNFPLPDAKIQYKASILFVLQSIAKLNQKKIPDPQLQESADRLSCAILRESITIDQPRLEQLLRQNMRYNDLNCCPMLLKVHAKELHTTLTSCFSHSDSFERDYAHLKQEIFTLAEYLLDAPKSFENDPKQRTLSLLFMLRDALSRPSYKLLSCDESNDCVHFLHTLAIACVVDVEAIGSYTYIGKKICQASALSAELDLAKTLEKVRKCAAEAGFNENDCVINDTFLSSAASWILPKNQAELISRTEDTLDLAIRHVKADLPVSLAWKNSLRHLHAYYFAPYKDYRGFYENNSCALYDETFFVDDGSVVCRTTLTPSPAAGSTILPEFRAVLQCLENTNRGQINQQHSKYSGMPYTNLQSKIGGTVAEALQTKALMDLCYIFPSFRPITLSQEPLDVREFGEHIKSLMLVQLTADASFSWGDPKDFGNWFPPHHKENWLSVFPEIISRAYDLVIKQPNIDDRTKIAAFQREVHDGISRFNVASLVIEQIEPNKRKDIVNMQNCAAGSDRGPMFHSSSVRAQSNESDVFITSMYIGRALAAKKRLPLSRRVRDLGAQATVISRHDHNQFFNDILLLADKTGNLQSQGIRILGNTRRTLNFN